MYPSRELLVRLLGMICLPLFFSSTPVFAQMEVADPDVAAQIELFSNWMEGQIEIRNLPGIVVGVVSGDDLVWTEGFGHADIESEKAMETTTRFRMASHSKLFTRDDVASYI